MDDFRGHHSIHRYFLAVGRVVIRDGEDDGGAVIELDELLHGSHAIGAVAHRFATMVARDRASHNLSRARRGIANEHCYGLLPDHLGWVSGRYDRRAGLPFQGGNRTGGNENLSRGASLSVVAGGAIAQVQNELVGALTVELRQVVMDLLGHPSVESGNAQVSDVAFNLVLDNPGGSQPRECDIDILWLRLAAVNHGELHGSSRLPRQQNLGLVDGHLAGGKAGDFLDHVAHLEPGFRSGTIGKGRDHTDISEALGKSETRRPLGFIRAFLFVIGVFQRTHIAGLRVERIKQAMQSPGSYLMKIRIIHVVALNVLQHFAVSGGGAEGFVVRGATENVSGSHVNEYDNRYRNHNLFCQWAHETNPFLGFRTSDARRSRGEA